MDINIIPHISTAPVISAAPNAGFDVRAAPDQFADPGNMVPGGEFGMEAAEPFTEEDCVELSEMLWSSPALMLGDHLEPDPNKVRKFGKQLYIYCSKKGVDPFDFMFDEFGLLITGGSIAITMYRSHKEHKGNKYTSAPDRAEKRVLDKPKKTANNDGIIQGEKQIFSDDDRAPKTETTEYEPNETPHEPVDYGELEFSRM